jgi:hypothetical protein
MTYELGPNILHWESDTFNIKAKKDTFFNRSINRDLLFIVRCTGFKFYF